LTHLDGTSPSSGSEAPKNCDLRQFFGDGFDSGTVGPVKTRTVWLLTLPFLLLSEAVGHTLVARLFDAGASRHRLVLHASGDYLAYAPAAIAALLMLAGALLVWRALSARAERALPLPAWRLAALVPLVFLLQEQLERVGWLTSAEPVVLAGLVPQMLCGLFALWLVRSLLRAADELGCALARRRGRAERLRAAIRTARAVQASPLRPRVLASRHAGRAPPALA
jgi:hypothetical protein